MEYNPNPPVQQPPNKGQMNFYMMSSNINIGGGGQFSQSQPYMPYDYGNYYYPPYNQQQPFPNQEFFPNKIDLKCNCLTEIRCDTQFFHSLFRP